MFCFVGVTACVVRADAQSIRPASERFADVKVEEVPDFRKHVVPLLGRLGCNDRACHGSFQGQGGLRLSLFGYDFKMDHTALTARASSGGGSRVNRQEPTASLIIAKPTLEVDHDGGDRFELGSWEHHILQRWIETGAEGTATPRELARLEIEPREIVFGIDMKPVQLRVVAVWQDDSREDVTPLCRFRTNDDAVVTVDEDGRLISAGPGDSDVIAFYDNGVAAVPVNCWSEMPMRRGGPTSCATLPVAIRINRRSWARSFRSNGTCGFTAAYRRTCHTTS